MTDIHMHIIPGVDDGWNQAKQPLPMGVHEYLDGLLGLAVGDALGVPYEKCSLQAMREDPCTGMRGYGAHQQPPGTWSDDTSMALCIADSLGTRGIDLDDVMKKFSSWKNRGRYTAAGATFDVGRICRKAIDLYDLGASVDLCGNAAESGNGNGGLMRNFPIALYASRNCKDTAEMLNLVHSYSAITHAHPVGLICCGMYALFIQGWLNRDKGDTVCSVMEQAIESGKMYYASAEDGFAEAISRKGLFLSAKEILSKTEEELPTSGYVVNTWNIAVWSLLNTDNYRDCVLKAVNLGGDADTNAAVAGSLAGFVYGCEDIPAEWLAVLLNQRLIRKIAAELDEAEKKDRNSVIDQFAGDYAFLSMKHKCSITMDGITYSNLTSAWLAQGVPAEHRAEFTGLTAHQARRLFKQLDKAENWEEQRGNLLYQVVLAKFEQNEELKASLVSTGSKPLVYDTTGSHDNILGRCSCDQCKNQNAQNLYGQTLMDVRQRISRM